MPDDLDEAYRRTVEYMSNLPTRDLFRTVRIRKTTNDFSIWEEELEEK